MTDINPTAAAARENARQDSGQFGAQEHTAPEATLPVRSRRQQRLDARANVVNGLHRQLRDEEHKLRIEYVASVIAEAPVKADSVVFRVDSHDFGTSFTFSHFTAADGSILDEDERRFDRDYFDDMASFFDGNEADQYMKDEGNGEFSIDVSKMGMHTRLRKLDEEWKSNDFGRSSREIGDDMDDCLTRFMQKDAAAKGFQSVTLDWDQEGRSGLRATHVTANDGRRRKAGSGDLDDHDIIWAAARFDLPTDRMTSTDGEAPFTLTFGS